MKVVIMFAAASCMLLAQVPNGILYEEYFTDGTMQLEWHPWFTDTTGIGDSMQVINDPTTPGGDDWAGKISNAYMGVAGLTYAGTPLAMDVDIDAFEIHVWADNAGVTQATVFEYY